MDKLSDLHRAVHELLEEHEDLELVGYDERKGSRGDFTIGSLEFNNDAGPVALLTIPEDLEEGTNG